MKVLLVMPGEHRELGAAARNRFYVPPLGIMYVSSYLKDKGFEVHCLNMNHDGPRGIQDVLNHNTFDAVCTGGMYSYIKAYENIFGLAKEKNKNVKTVLGGAAATAHPEFILSELKPDFLVLGEGEETTADLLRAINDGGGTEDVPGIAYFDNVHDRFVMTNPRPPMRDIDALPLPDREGFGFSYFLEHYHKYSTLSVRYKRENIRTAFVVGGRDCPGRCTFCFRVMGGKVRYRSIDNVIREIRLLKEKYDVNEIEMLDDVFSIDKRRVYDFCQKIGSLGIHWWCQMNVRHVDEEMLKAMKMSGCDWVGYGFESASDTVLKSMNKGIKVEHIEKALMATRKAKLSLQANFIFGDPAETLETAEETLKFWRKHKSFHINLSYVIPYPGTKLYNDLIKRNEIRNLRHFWDNNCVDEDGRTRNLTSLTENEERLLRLRVFLEKLNPSSYIVRRAEREADGRYVLDLGCPVCQKEFKEIFLTRPQIVACPDCCQRAAINPYDLPGLNVLDRKIRKSIRFTIVSAGRIIFRSKPIGLFLIWFFVMSRNRFNYYNLLNAFNINLLKKSKVLSKRYLRK